MAVDFSDFYILYNGHPLYNDTKMIEDEVIRSILQKWEVVLYTNRGDLFFDPDFGGDLEYYLHQTKLSSQSIEDALIYQINTYIPELVTNNISYNLSVGLYEDPDRHMDYMQISFSISDYNAIATIF